VHGELWEARCEAGADVGEAVRVSAVEDLMLVVEPLEESSGSGDGRRLLDGSG